MQENGWMIIEKVMENITGKIVMYMYIKDNRRVIEEMVKENKFGKMVVYIKDNGKMIKEAVKVS